MSCAVLRLNCRDSKLQKEPLEEAAAPNDIISGGSLRRRSLARSPALSGGQKLHQTSQSDEPQRLCRLGGKWMELEAATVALLSR